MGRKQKLKAEKRAALTGNIDVKNLTPYQAKKCRQFVRDDFAYPIRTYKEFPCQMLPGEKVLIDINCQIFEGPDGLHYYNDPKGTATLIVSEKYERQIAETKATESFEKSNIVETSIRNMKPTPLG